MKKLKIVTIIAIFLLGCTKQKDSFYTILNENFEIFTDTVAYKYHAFLIAPNEEVPDKKKFDGYKICIDKNFEDSKDFRNYLKKKLDKSKFSGYSNLLHTNQEYQLKLIDVSMLNEIKKFEIVDLSNCKEDEVSSYIGTMRFYRPLINETNAILFCSKHVSDSVGVVDAYLFKNNNGKWEFELKIELGRW
jgi:hypothetical protein